MNYNVGFFLKLIQLMTFQSSSLTYLLKLPEKMITRERYLEEDRVLKFIPMSLRHITFQLKGEKLFLFSCYFFKIRLWIKGVQPQNRWPDCGSERA